MSMIEDLYLDMSQEFKRSEDYEEVRKDFRKDYEKILKLIPDEKNLLDDLCYLSGGLESEYGRTCFKEGFKVALLLAAECVD